MSAPPEIVRPLTLAASCVVVVPFAVIEIEVPLAEMPTAPALETVTGAGALVVVLLEVVPVPLVLVVSPVEPLVVPVVEPVVPLVVPLVEPVVPVVPLVDPVVEPAVPVVEPVVPVESSAFTYSACVAGRCSVPYDGVEESSAVDPSVAVEESVAEDPSADELSAGVVLEAGEAALDGAAVEAGVCGAGAPKPGGSCPILVSSSGGVGAGFADLLFAGKCVAAVMP
ncbi:MAG TPA: hypothetical protein VGL76_04230 [Gaiellaceae bacterium]